MPRDVPHQLERCGERPRRLPVWLVVGLGVLLMGLIPGFLSPSPAFSAGLEDSRRQLDQARGQLGRIQSELDGLAEEYARSEARLYELDLAVTAAEAEAERSRVDLQAVEARFESRLVDIYKARGDGFSAFVKVLFEERDFLRVIQRAGSLNRIAGQDDDLRQEIRGHLERVGALEAELESKREEQTAALAQLESAQETMEGRMEAVSAEYSRLQTEVARLEEEARRRAEEEAKRREAAAKAAAQAAGAAKSAGQKTAASPARSTVRPADRSSGGTAAISGFVFPVAGAHSYINDWGFSRSGGRSHQGTDIMAPRGTPVVAVVSGRVTRTTQNSGLGGTTVWLRGNDGRSYYFAHLDTIAGGISSGSSVGAGQTLATVGNSGNARGGATHLHFEIRTGSGAINPYPVLRAADG